MELSRKESNIILEEAQKTTNSKKFRLAPNVDDLREIVGTHNFNSLILVDIYLGIYTQNKEILRGWSTEVIVV